MEVIAQKNKDISKMDTAKSYFKKKVRSKSGDNVGRVCDVIFTGKGISGIVARKGPVKVYVDKSFISSVADNTIMLSINPVTALVGKQVFDADGRKLGRVAKVIRKNQKNDFDELVVRKYKVLSELRIPKEDVEVQKKNIILKKIYD